MLVLLLVVVTLLKIVLCQSLQDLDEPKGHTHHIHEYNRKLHRIPTALGPKLRMGRSETPDFFGSYYYFFVFEGEMDTVSRVMVESGGMWERPLNLMFKHFVDERRQQKGAPGENADAVDNANSPSVFQPNVIDVGVNVGAFTMFAASCNSRVWGFDIQDLLLTMVYMGLRVNEYKHLVRLHDVAVWDRDGLNFTFVPELGNFGGTSIVADIAKDRRPISDKAEDRISVSSYRIDEMYDGDKEIFFLKMDCEGCEPRAMMGMDSIILARRVKHIVTEICGDVTILEPLYHLGYRCRVFDDKKDCQFPTIGPDCDMPTFEGAKNTFITRRPYSHWDLYMDVHCELVSHPPVALNTLREGWALDGQLVKLKNSDDVYRIVKDKRVFQGSQVDMTTVKEISYGTMYMYAIDRTVQ